MFDKLCQLKVNKAMDPDGLHSYVLKSCASSPLTILCSQPLYLNYKMYNSDFCTICMY